jgi:hypothetical protein
MAYLIIFLMFIAFCGFWMMLNMPPQKIASLLVHSGPIVIIGLGVVLTLLRRGVIGLPLIFLGLSLWRRSRSMRPPTYSDGHTSKVRSVYLEMELDHDTGEMDGRVLRGRLEGVKLSSLDETEILSLYHDISDDADSVALLESFLDRYYSDWRENYEHGSSTGTGGASGFESMSRDEAYQILGLEPGASQEEIHQAWRRLVKAVHPDSGGSAFLTAKINAARDLLLS